MTEHRNPEIRYPFDREPEPGCTRVVAPGLRWLAMPMPGSLSFINFYLIEDAQGWWAVDTGLAGARTEALWQKILATELDGKPIIGVICTHMHPDHIGQAIMLTDHWRCPLYMTAGEYYQARAFANSNGKSEWLGQQFYSRAGMPADYLDQLAKMWSGPKNPGMSMPAIVPGFERLREGQVLQLGGHTWQIIVGSGHSPEYACLYCAHHKILISGDQVLPIITSNVSVHPNEPNANPLKDWMASHERFLRLIPNDTLVLPAHNLPFYGVQTRLRELIRHHEDRLLAIEAACREPQIAKDLLPVLFTRTLEPGQMMMALGEAVAHIHLLMAEGRIQRSVGAQGRYRFQTTGLSLERRAHS